MLEIKILIHACAEEHFVFGQESDGDGRLGETLLREEGWVGHHHVKRTGHLGRHLQRVFVVVEAKVAAVRRKPLIVLEQRH